jgi:hypothetical protein
MTRRTSTSMFPIAALALALQSGPVRAEVDAAGFLYALNEHRSSARTYILGISTGVTAANNAARSATGRPLFCLPQDMSITPEQQIDILKHYLLATPDDASLPVSQAVINSLVHGYPCRTG